MTEEFERYKYDQARAYLEHVRDLSCNVQSLHAEIEAQRELADGMRSRSYGDCGNSAPGSDRTADTVAMLQELIGDYCTELAAYVAEQKRAHECIKLMERRECSSAITRRYLLNNAWERVCVDMGYTWDGMMKLRRRAITDFYDVMPLEWRDPMHPAS